MGFGLQEMLVMAGLLVIGVILFDFVRRYRRQKNSDLRMDLDLTGSVSGDPFNAELPSGSARAVDIAAGDVTPSHPGSHRAYEMDNLDDMDSESFGPAINGVFSDDSDQAFDRSVGTSNTVTTSRHTPRSTTSSAYSAAARYTARRRGRSVGAEGAVLGTRGAHYRSNVMKRRGLYAGKSAVHSGREASASNSESDAQRAHTMEKGTPRDILSITLIARPGASFAGKDLARVFIEEGLRYGEHDVFHYYSLDLAMHEKPLISVTNGLKPGTFDLSQLDAFSTTAISLYLPLPGPADPEAAFSRFLTLANDLGRKLGARLCDAHKKPLTQNALEVMHARLERVCVGAGEERAEAGGDLELPAGPRRASSSDPEIEVS
ncbi:MAG: cell division protein ZipA C-terminal FtsZ-binding domain-containing protein [Gammaproteobacteria bacterium]